MTYLGSEHAVNQARSVARSQIGAALLGLLSFAVLEPGYLSGGVAVVAAIVAMTLLDPMLPPVLPTALSFRLKADDESIMVLLGLAVAMTAGLIVQQTMAQSVIKRANACQVRRRAPPS